MNFLAKIFRRSKRRDPIDLDELENVDLKLGDFIVKYRDIEARVRIRSRERIELLFVLVGDNEKDESPWFSILPGSRMAIRLGGKANSETIANLVATIARRFMALAGDQENRVFFILESQPGEVLAALSSIFSNSVYLIADSMDPEGTERALPDDFSGRLLALEPDGLIRRLDQESGKFRVAREAVAGESAELALRDAARLALDLAETRTIRVSPVEIRLEHLYIYSFAPNINRERLEFVCSGRPDLPPAVIDENFDWNANPYNDKNWAAQLHMWRVMDDYLIRYEKSGDRSWLDAPAKVIRQWRDFYRDNEPSEAVWTDMNAGIRAMKLAFFLSLIQRGAEEFDGEFVKICEELAERHILFIVNHKKSVFTNHSLIDLHGLTALCQVAEPVLASLGYDYIEANYDAILDSQFDRNGVHREHSPGYQLFAHGYLRILANAGWFKTKELRKLASQSAEALDWMHLPDRRLAPIGDTDGNSPGKFAALPPSDKEIFNRSGYAIIRRIRRKNPEKSSYLFFMGASNSKVHKHSDDLSVFWYEGEDILCDSGKYAYQPSPRRDYVVSTRAHNTIEINGSNTFEGGAKDNPPPGNYIKSVRESGGLFFLTGEMTAPRFQVAHARRLIYDPGKFLIVIDRMRSRNLNKYVARWHFPSSALVEQTDESEFEGRLKSGKSIYAALYATRASRPELVRGQIAPIMQGFVSESYRLLTPNYCASLATEGDNVSIVSAFFLDRRPAINFYDNSLLFFNNYMYDAERNRLSSL